MFSIKLYLDEERVATSLSLRAMQQDMLIRNLQIYLYGPNRAEAHAVDLENNQAEIEINMPSDGSGMISTGLSPFVLTLPDGSYAEVTKDMLLQEAKKNVGLRIYASFEVTSIP